MSVLGNNILAGASGQGGSYTMDRSLRLRSSASAYLSRTFGTPTNSAKWTFSRWLKRGAIGARQSLFAAGSSGSSYANIEFKSDDTIQFLSENSSLQFQLVTTQVFRDPSAWYNIHIIYDSANATSTDRIQLWVNGVRVTAFSTATYPSSPNNLFNTAIAHQIGVLGYGSVAYFDGYMTEVNFIDGQALDPTYFGEYNADTGVWQPIKYTGTYGTNGFYLNFSDNSTTTTLGYDTSGNSNNWTANNISVTSGVTYDSMTDVPTLTSEDAANYATLNPLDIEAGSNTFSNGNLSATTGTFTAALASIQISSGKWYWEVTANLAAGTPQIGIAKSPIGTISTNSLGQSANAYLYVSNGNKANNNSFTAYGATYTTNDVIGVALDLDAGTLVFYKNGASQGTAFSSLSGSFRAAFANCPAITHINFGQRPFAYTPPAGFKSLNTYNLPDSTIEDGSEYFNTVLYTGTGSTQSITGVGFQPDWLWTKARSVVQNHGLVDAVRGSSQRLYSDLTNAEDVFSGITSFDSDGFTVDGLRGTSGTSGVTYVAWNWKANGSGVSNTDGSITSTVSANTTAGFSIVTYTGNGTAGATVGHGLGVAPSMVIVKTRESSNTWRVGHDGLTSWAYQLRLDDTAGQALNNNIFNSTAPTSTVFTVGSSATTNESTKGMVAYCFADVEGYSKFGSYTGNGSTDGPFVFTGFRPAYVLVKNAAVANSWRLWDNKRPSYNVTNLYLSLDTSGAEGAINIDVDLLSNGFKIRNTNSSINGSGNSIIYMAFAENPFKNALAR